MIGVRFLCVGFCMRSRVVALAFAVFGEIFLPLGRVERFEGAFHCVSGCVHHERDAVVCEDAGFSRFVEADAVCAAQGLDAGVEEEDGCADGCEDCEGCEEGEPG